MGLEKIINVSRQILCSSLVIGSCLIYQGCSDSSKKNITSSVANPPAKSQSYQESSPLEKPQKIDNITLPQESYIPPPRVNVTISFTNSPYDLRKSALEEARKFTENPELLHIMSYKSMRVIAVNANEGYHTVSEWEFLYKAKDKYFSLILDEKTKSLVKKEESIGRIDLLPLTNWVVDVDEAIEIANEHDAYSEDGIFTLSMGKNKQGISTPIWHIPYQLEWNRHLDISALTGKIENYSGLKEPKIKKVGSGRLNNSVLEIEALDYQTRKTGIMEIIDSQLAETIAKVVNYRFRNISDENLELFWIVCDFYEDSDRKRIEAFHSIGKDGIGKKVFTNTHLTPLNNVEGGIIADRPKYGGGWDPNDKFSIGVLKPGESIVLPLNAPVRNIKAGLEKIVLRIKYNEDEAYFVDYLTDLK